MQLAVQLPSLPRVRGQHDPRRLSRRQEGPAEGPQEGSALHLRDKVHVDVHINIRAIDNNGLLAADAYNVAEAFGGGVAPG